jgi:hypothetical protein
MNVLFVSSTEAVTPHLETELEIAQLHLDNNDQVFVMSCWGELPGCDTNIKADRKKCENCKLKRKAGWSLLSGKIKNVSIGKTIKFPYKCSIPKNIRNAEDLKKWDVQGSNLGWGVMSSLVSAVQSPEPNFRSSKWLIQRFGAASEQVYKSVKSFLEKNKIDRVYVYNGRLATCRSVVRACECTGIEYLVHERGADSTRYKLFQNCLPHDISYNSSEIVRLWNEENNIEIKTQLADEWFRNRRNKVSKNWYSFTDEQKDAMLPENWDEKKYNIAIFTSSEDEYVSIGDMWENHIYKSQAEGVQQIIRDLLSNNKNVHIYVRMHPNQRRLNNSQTNLLRCLSYPNTTILPPESKVDTYTLAQKANVVVSFGSTVGIEAVYWGTPSILLGRSFYQQLGAVDSANSHEDGIKAILNTSLGNREMALAYGYWANTRGITFKYFEAEGFYAGKFKGEKINGRVSSSALQKLKWSISKQIKILFERLF